MPVICSYTMLLTVYYVPYTTLIMELSDDPAERDTATTWRMTLEVFMTVVAVLMQSFVIAALAPDEADGSVGGSPFSGPADRQTQRVAYLTAAIVTNSVVILPGLYTACFVRERPMFTKHKGCRIDCGGEDPDLQPLLGRTRTKEETSRAVRPLSLFPMCFRACFRDVCDLFRRRRRRSGPASRTSSRSAPA